MSKDLRQFLQVVKEAGPDFYVEVKKPLKAKIEPCVIQEKLAKEGRFPVIYCPQIEGSKLPLVTNLWGSYELLGVALDMDPQKVTKTEIFQEYRRRENDLKPPQMVPASEAPVKEVVLRGKDVDLGLLPIIHHHQLDSGKYVTPGCMICKDPDTGIPNVGMYRHEVRGKDQLGCHMSPTHHGAHITRRYAELGKPMEVVIFIGHHPAVGIGSVVRGSLDRNELEVMGALLGEPLQVTTAETVDLPVPAYAEIAIEGVIDPRNWITDGPFAEYTGYYGESKSSNLIQVTGITMRKDAIFHDLDPGHREHNLCGVLAKESITYDAVKRLVPTVKAVYTPSSGCNVFHTYVSIKKCLQGEGKLAGLAALSEDVSLKVAVVVDEDIDVYNEEEMLWAIATRVTADLDISIIPGVTGQNLDPTRYDETRHERDGGYMVSKMIIDATKPVDLSFPTRITLPEELWNSMSLDDYLK